MMKRKKTLTKLKKTISHPECDPTEILREAQKAVAPGLSIFENRKEVHTQMVQKEVVRYLCTEVGGLREALANLVDRHYEEGEDGIK